MGLNACAGAPDGVLLPHVPVAGTVAGMERSADHPLALEDGDYVEGTLESGAEPAELRLVDRQGRPIRLLLDGTTGREVFRFVAEPGMAALRVTLRSPGGYELALTRRIPVKDQHPVLAGHLSPAIEALAADLKRGGGTGAFWREVAQRGTPLVEPLEPGRVVMTFLARGARHNVRLLGGPTSNHERLERLGDSDVWFKSFVVPSSTRLSYKIAPDVPDFPGTCRECREAILAQLRADPLNRTPWPADAPDPYNQFSLVKLADAPPQPGLAEPGSDGTAEPAGRLVTERFASRSLDNTRDVAVYVPPGVDPAGADTVLLLLFDGPDYLGPRAPAPIMLDRLTGDGRLPPTVGVFIANPSAAARAHELPANPAFAAMLADELVPWLAGRMGIRPRPDRTVLAGSSYGGLAAVTAALARPDRFGNALSMSGSFWWHPAGAAPDRQEYVAGLAASRERLPVRFFLSAGLFETTVDDEIGILESSRHLRDVLEAKGYDVVYRDYAGGHDHFVWRGALGDGLLALFQRRR